MSKSIFILKRREDYNSDPSYSGSYQIATGMWNSALFVGDALQANGRQSMVEMVQDGNGIDALVTAHDPQYVFIEGLWVTPAKFAELLAIPRHQHRTWVVRIHSEIPFLSTEGVAMDWIAQYLDLGITVAPNAPRIHQQLSWYAVKHGLTEVQAELQVPYLPNIYPTTFDPISGLDTSSKTVLDIACFGAVRPLKNHLQQAFIAGRFAEELGLQLRFHINDNGSGAGAGPLKNVSDAIVNMGAELIVHAWEDRDTFLQSLRNVDLLMQNSISETFNIVAADATLVGRPILPSAEISWAYPVFADPQNVDASLKALRTIWRSKSFFIQHNRRGLQRQVAANLTSWLRFVTV